MRFHYSDFIIQKTKIKEEEKDEERNLVFEGSQTNKSGSLRHVADVLSLNCRKAPFVLFLVYVSKFSILFFIFPSEENYAHL